MKRMASALAAATLVVVSLVGCGGSDERTGSHASPARTKLTVFAAPSLEDAFGNLEKDFEAANPGIDVVFTYAESKDLVTQMSEGAQADVFAPASTTWMNQAEDKGLVPKYSSEVFALDTLELAVAKGNPKNNEDLEDLAARPELVAVRCASAVPCGEATDRLVRNAFLDDLRFDTEEQSSRDALGLLKAGEADAAIVYESDVASAEDTVDGVDLAGAQLHSNTYEIAVTKDAKESTRSEAAQKYVDLVLSHEGQMTIVDAGFRPVK
ncbi:molybdate ABC transporter substrate-binding protein [Dermabacter sp. HMSC08H10]|uniref:molybdate ABC transporter substrate-binding protein n=1 Tax=Dermabacter sp. HMSC08H10 TaxID=1581144 RepID=UPI0008A194E8|nr:molybdate ABC transporter substrate-binding protein [Dermabacter sp. HMSC08H10]OFT22030.1 hypothetical protein HMPREF3176_00165 [Dermabacter sp. HMSC08H10]